MKDYLFCSKIYQKLATIYVIQHEFKNALVSYKLMLKYSWISGSKEFELKSYEGVAHCYYYLEDLKKSLFYHSRFSRGKIEPEDSNIKSYSIDKYENKFYNKSL